MASITPVGRAYSSIERAANPAALGRDVASFGLASADRVTTIAAYVQSMCEGADVLDHEVAVELLNTLSPRARFGIITTLLVDMEDDVKD